jgi:predicted Rossmann fold flavoprotein
MIGAFTSRFTQEQTWDWFERAGVKLKVEEDGRCFPVTDRAETVAGALREAAKRAGVVLELGARVTALDRRGEDEKGTGQELERQALWSVHVQRKQKSGAAEVLAADAVMLATGSSPLGYQLASQQGHSLLKTMPSLFSFRLARGHALEGLQGVTLSDVELTLAQSASKTKTNGKRMGANKGNKTHIQRGSLLITHRGVSGPAALRLSSFAAVDLCDCRYMGELQLRCLPDETLEKVRQTLQQKFVAGNGLVSGGANSKYPFAKQIPRRLWAALAEEATHGRHPCARWSDLRKEEMRRLCDLLAGQGLSLPFRGKDTNKEEFVTAGGVDLKEVDLRTCESKRCGGLYFGGEVMNIDGVTGGFNFQSCWTTGFIVGEAVGRAFASD